MNINDIEAPGSVIFTEIRKGPSVANATFSRLDDIIIRRAEAGGFIISLDPGNPGMMHRMYAACSTAEETADLIKTMLAE